MTAPWSERRDIADQVDEANAAWRDEIASQRNEDAHLIWDDTPTRAECEADEWGSGPLGPDPWLPFTCQRCGSVDSGGMPEKCDGCGMRNWGTP